MLPEMVRYEPTWEDLELLKDGGVAIIDQWICAHARYSTTPSAGISFLSQQTTNGMTLHFFLCHRCTKPALSIVLNDHLLQLVAFQAS